MNRTRTRNRSGRRRGVATVELALVAPFVFLLVMTSIEVSRMMMVRQALTNAAREGCRHATLITTQSTSDTKQLVKRKLKGVIKNDEIESVVRVKVLPESVAALSAGTEITTEIEVDCGDVSWLPPTFFAGEDPCVNIQDQRIIAKSDERQG